MEIGKNMNNNTFKKKLVVIFVTLLFSTTIIPIINTQSMDITQKKHNLKTKDIRVEINVYYPYKNNWQIKNMELSGEEILNLKESLTQAYDNSNSLREIYETQLDILKIYNIIPPDLEILTILRGKNKILEKNSNINFSNITMNFATFGLGNSISFLGIGEVKSIGPTHIAPNSPLVGFDWYFRCSGLMYYATFSAMTFSIEQELTSSAFDFSLKEKYLNIISSGDYVGTFGLFYGILIRFSNKLFGPFVFGLGISALLLLLLGINYIPFNLLDLLENRINSLK
jgi:hypothetical protein